MKEMLSPNIEYRKHEPIIIQKPVTIGKRLILASTATEGPYYEPTYIHNKQVLEITFGNGRLISLAERLIEQEYDCEIICVRIKSRDFNTLYKALAPFPFDLIYIDDFRFGQSLDDIESFKEFAEEKQEVGQL